MKLLNKYNKIGMIILVMTLLCVVAIPTANAFLETKSYDEDTKTYTIYSWLFLDEKVKLKLISNTDQCLINCKAEIDITPDLDLTIEDIKKYFWEFENQEGLVDYNVYWEVEEEYDEIVFDKGACNKTWKVYNNETKKYEMRTYESECITGNHIEKATRKIQEEFLGKELKKGETYRLVLEGIKKPNQDVEWFSWFYGMKLKKWAWWHANWLKHRTLSVEQTNTSVLTNLTILVNGTNYTDTASLISAGKMQIDCDDIRFVDENNITELRYEFENKTDGTYGCNTDNTTIWLNLPAINVTSQNRTIYMYYDNLNASAPTYLTQNYPSDYAHVWHFGEGSGNNTNDSSGSYNGSSFNATWDDGIFGNAFNFTNLNSYANFGDIPTLNEATISMWFEGHSGAVTRTNGVSLFVKDESGYNKDYYATTTDNNHYISIDNGTANCMSGIFFHAADVLDKWYKLDIVIGNNTNVSIYLDGIIHNVSEKVCLGIDGSVANFTIGGQASPIAAAHLYEGMIDEVRIYNRNLTEAEIKRNYEYDLSLFGSEEGVIFENSTNYNATTYETNRESFELNITYPSNSYIDISANLIYNGTYYSSTKTGTGDHITFTNILDIPLVTDGTSDTNSFLWEITLFTSTISMEYNTSIHSQTVHQITLDECIAGGNNVSLNFTAWDEGNLSQILPYNFYGTFYYWSGSGSIKRNITNEGQNETLICISPANATFYTNAIIEYGDANSTYVSRQYYLNDHILTNVTEHIYLYLLPVTDATTFIIQVEDKNYLAMPNIFTHIQRYYSGTGTYRTVQIARTDGKGKSVGFYKTEVVIYRHLLYDSDNELLLQTDDQKIYGEEVPYTLHFRIGVGFDEPWDNFRDLENLVSNMSFNKTSKIVTFTYSDTSGSFNNATLYVEHENHTVGIDVICNNASTETTGIITCNLSRFDKGSFVAKAYIQRSPAYLIHGARYVIETALAIFGDTGAMVGWFIILVSCMAFVWHPIAGIWGINAAVIFVNLMGLVTFSPVWIFALLALSILLTIKFNVKN